MATRSTRSPAPPRPTRGMRPPTPGPQQYPPGAIMPDDPRLQAGGGPLGYSGTYYQVDKGGGAPTYWMPKVTEQEIQTARNAPKGSGLTQQQVQTNPKLYDVYRQQHPNGPLQFTGPGATPEEQAKAYAAKGRSLWQQAVVNQQNSPGKGGSQPMPQGGLAVTTPGIPAGDDPYWAQQGKAWYQKQYGG